MTADLTRRRSPLAGDPHVAGWSNLDGLQMREVPFAAQVNLRVDPASESTRRIGRALGTDLPVEPNTTAAGGPRHVLWLGPDEWLVVGPDGDADAIERRLREALSGGWGSVVDVSANRTVIEISGRHARDVLARGCSLDLHPRAFRPGTCAQTLLARAAVILWQVDEAPTFRVFVRASVAASLARWLCNAVAEYTRPATDAR